jgi:hypothetical protein
MVTPMSFKDIAAPLVSMFAAAISILFFVLSFRLSRRMADRSLNLEAHKMLLDLNRQLIADPRLWVFYDDHPLCNDRELNDKSPLFRAKLEAFAYLQLNMFEIVVLEVPEPSTGEDRNPSNVWCDFFFDTLARSSVMRSILDRPNSAKIYNTVLLMLYDQWKSEVAVVRQKSAQLD